MTLQLYSPAAEELLMATCAQESLLGKYRHQVNGPAIGIFQMEPEDHDDIWKNFLAYKPALAATVKAFAPRVVGHPLASEMQENDPYAIAMCRVHYVRAPDPLPAATNLNALWNYYKRFYNTPQGAATQAEFYEHYKLTGGLAK
jgi:hypothetical protein